MKVSFFSHLNYFNAFFFVCYSCVSNGCVYIYLYVLPIGMKVCVYTLMCTSIDFLGHYVFIPLNHQSGRLVSLVFYLSFSFEIINVHKDK